MTSDRRNMLKLAILLAEAAHDSGPKGRTYLLPGTTWQECVDIDRQIRRAESRGLRLAAKRRRRDMRSCIRQLASDLRAVEQAISPPSAAQHHASTRDVYADLQSLGQEFDDVAIDWKQKTLSVTTEPIILQNIELGPFEIRLVWDDATADHPFDYKIVAKEPNPVESSGETTHPHVQDESLCEGEAQASIRRVLEEGRLLDFFLIVRNLLRTYSPSSPYVRLEDWDGIECFDCGTVTPEDERWTCEHCERVVCGDCYFTCPGCQEVFCSDCVTSCVDCGDSCCNNCIHDNERCAGCHEEKTKNDEIADAPVQPDGVGQAAVPA